MNNIIVQEHVRGTMTLCTSDKNIEYDVIIKSLEALSHNDHRLTDIELIVLKTLSSIGFDKQEHTSYYKDADLSIDLWNSKPYVYVFHKKKVKYVYVNKVKGNCIDKFVTFNMHTFVENIHRNMDTILSGQKERMDVQDYHNSARFETDYAALTRIKEMCDKMSGKIQRLQENLTLADYTS